MLEGLAPDLTARLMIAIGGVALAFLILIAVLVFLKRKNSPLFVKGGRGREHRLVVLDAAAVDAKRRLVLIRRDDTEHLIMIGGPTDIVIETGIRDLQRPVSEERIADRHPAAEADFASELRATSSAANRRPPEEHLPVARAPAKAEPAKAEPTPRPVVAERPTPPRVAVEPGLPIATPTAARTAAATGISAMGSVLYDEDREPFGGDLARSASASPRSPVTPVVAKPQPEVSDAQPLTAAAEDMLDQARNRVLAGPVQAGSLQAEQKSAADEAAVKAMAERLEAARLEGLRIEAAKAEAARAEAARIEAQRVEAERQRSERADAARLEAQKMEMQRREAQRQDAERLDRERAEARRLESARLRAEAEKRAQAEEAARRAQAVASQAPQPEPVADTVLADSLPQQSRDTLASDFEKLLEVELQRGGVFDGEAAPQVELEPRDTVRTASVYPVPRDAASVVTGATPGVSVEQDMARRLGEINLNKKTEQL